MDYFQCYRTSPHSRPGAPSSACCSIATTAMGQTDFDNVTSGGNHMAGRRRHCYQVYLPAVADTPTAGRPEAG